MRVSFSRRPLFTNKKKIKKISYVNIRQSLVAAQDGNFGAMHPYKIVCTT